MVLGTRAEAGSISGTSLIIWNSIVKYNNRVAVQFQSHHHAEGFGARLPRAEQFRDAQQDEFICVSLEELAPGTEGKVIVVANNDVIPINGGHIFNGEEGEGEAVTRCVSRAIAPDPCPTIGVPDGHQVNMPNLANKAIRIGLRHIHKVNPLEARR